MRKVILTAPNKKRYITKTPYTINDTFMSLAPSIRDTNKFFSENDLSFIKNELVPTGLVTAIDAMQFIGRGATIFTMPLDGRKREAKVLEYFAWDKAYQFIKDNLKNN